MTKPTVRKSNRCCSQFRETTKSNVFSSEEPDLVCIDIIAPADELFTCVLRLTMSQSPRPLHHGKQSANHIARALPIPVERLDNAQIFQTVADLTKRSPPGSASSSATSSGASSSPSSTCGPNDNTGVCQKPTQTATLPIVLGAVYVVGS